MKAIPFLRKIRNQLKETESDYRYISMCFDDCEKVKNYNGIQSRSFYMKLEKYGDYQIIIDEDIMRTLLDIESVSISKLVQIKKNFEPSCSRCFKDRCSL